MRALERREREARDLLVRAALFRWLACAFAYPVPGHAQRMARDFARLDRARLGELLPPALAKALARAGRAWRGQSDGVLAGEYARLFLCAQTVSLHETAYGDARRVAGRAVELADLNGFYLAFGLTLGDRELDLPDHLSVELEFLSLVLVKEAYARSRGRAEAGRIAHEAAGAFLRDHLGRWPGAVAASLTEQAPRSPYDVMAALTEAAVAAECRRRRVQPVALAGRLFDFAQSDVFACPHATPAHA